jgi:hypothetical protein
MEKSSQLNFPGTLHKSEEPFSPILTGIAK